MCIRDRIKNVRGNILWGILATWIIGIICQFAGVYVPNPEIGFYSLLPDFSNGLSIPSLAPVFGKLDFSGVFSLNFIVVIFAFLFVDMFDTIGTLIGAVSYTHLFLRSAGGWFRSRLFDPCTSQSM